MSNGNKAPQTPREDGDGDPEKRSPRPRSFTGPVLVLLVLFIVYLVVSNQWGAADPVTYPALVDRLASGKVKKIEVERNILQVELLPEKGKIRGGEKKTLALPSGFVESKLVELEELFQLGEQAATKSEDDSRRMLAQLARNEALRNADGRESSAFDFVVYRRYVLNLEDLGDCVLVKMGRPPVNGGNERGGPRDVDHVGKPVAYLFRPTQLPAVDGQPGESITFNRILQLTNTSAANQKNGLASVDACTVDLSSLDSGNIEFKEDTTIWQTMLVTMIPWLLIIVFLWFFVFRQMRSNGMGGNVLAFGRSRAKMASKEKTGITFADVAGIEEAKGEVEEVVEFLKHPGRFSRLGGRIPRGILLVGPPGTGKTLLAKAIAGEAEVPFYSICGSDFVEMFVGVGASRVRDLFKQARENSPCIIFLDEIDAVGRRRGAGLGGGHDEREQTLNAILVEMDGFDTDTGIIVIAATNRVDVLDPALLRPGRFDREIYVDLPDVKGREAILKVHARKVKMHPAVDMAKIARATPGFSGAELEAVVNEAALLATMNRKEFIYDQDLEEARDRVRWGRAKTSRIMDDHEKKVTAYHEAGHTLAAILAPHADPIHKVTIIPRGQSLGATMYLPEKDQYSFTREKARSYLQICFGGRVAEEVFFADITSGAANDLKQATGVAMRMVKEWGMSEALGPVSYDDGDENVFLGRELARSPKMGGETADAIDREVRRILEEAHSNCKSMILANKEKLELIAESLLEYEVLSKEEIDGLLAGETVPAVRARQDAKRVAAEREANDATPVRPEPRAVVTPDPKLPPGLAGEGV